MIIEEIAYQAAMLDGGRIVFNSPSEGGGCTLAYWIGRREGWWKYGRGVFNAECCQQYAERNWQNYMPLCAVGQEP